MRDRIVKLIREIGEHAEEIRADDRDDPWLKLYAAHGVNRRVRVIGTRRIFTITRRRRG